MQVADPAALAVGLGLLAGLPGASLVRRGRRLLGAAGAAAAGAALAAGVLELPGSAGGLAAAAGFAAALALPGFGLGRFRRRSFGTSFGRGSEASLAEARLPARLASARPSELVDPADRLRLEGAIEEAERKSGAQLALAVVRRAGPYEGASWRLAAWCAALALAAACAFATGEPRLAPAAALLAALGGRTLAHAPRLRRFASSEAELAENAARSASDAFAQLALGRAPAPSVLVFAALFEGRVIVLGDPGRAGAHTPEKAWSGVAAAAAAGLAAGRLEGLVAALEDASALATGGPPAGARPSASERPLPVRIED
jgi:uncharacterized membrane protein